MFNTNQDKHKSKLGCIYKISCNSCNKLYINETKREAAEAEENMHDKSAIVNQSIENHFNHTINENIKILTKESNWYKRKFGEALYIKKYQTSVVNQDQGMHINHLWNHF